MRNLRLPLPNDTKTTHTMEENKSILRPPTTVIAEQNLV